MRLVPTGLSLLTKTRFTETQSHAFSHLIFALSFGLCAYNFFRSISLDPGTCPKPASDAELKSVRVHVHVCAVSSPFLIALS